MSTLTIAQVASQAGDPYASMASAGQYPVTVVTASGKVRNVTSAGFGSGLVLITGGSGHPLTVREIVASAGGNSDASLATFGHAPVTVETRTGKTRPVTAAAFDGSSVVLTTGK
jgi:hypothetical protein